MQNVKFQSLGRTELFVRLYAIVVCTDYTSLSLLHNTYQVPAQTETNVLQHSPMAVPNSSMAHVKISGLVEKAMTHSQICSYAFCIYTVS